jgi:hypothetical protein
MAAVEVAAATSGMTYQSEPVSSPWNRPPWPVAMNERKADANAMKVSQYFSVSSLHVMSGVVR